MTMDELEEEEEMLATTTVFHKSNLLDVSESTIYKLLAIKSSINDGGYFCVLSVKDIL